MHSRCLEVVILGMTAVGSGRGQEGDMASHRGGNLASSDRRSKNKQKKR